MSGSQSWAVRIVSTSSGGAAFQPWGVNANPGDPVKAQVGDIVTWGNATNTPHQPWPTEGNAPNGPPATSNPEGSALFFSRPINPNDSSTPQFVVPSSIPAAGGGNPTPLAAGSVIYYCCKNHPTEYGQIVIF